MKLERERERERELVGRLLVSRSGLVEEDAVEVFRYYGFHFPLLSCCTISSPFRENNNVVVFPFLFHIFLPLFYFWLIRLQGQFPIVRALSLVH